MSSPSFFVEMALVRFLSAAEHGVVGFTCYEPGMGLRGCGVVLPVVAGFRPLVDH